LNCEADSTSKTQSTPSTITLSPFLTGLGYTVLSVGNSQKPSRNDTLVSFKKEKTQYKDIITKDMEKNYKLTFDENLTESTEYDVLITVGIN